MAKYLLKLVALLGLLSGATVTHATGAFTLEDWLATPAGMKPVYVKAIMEQASIHKVTFVRSPEFYVAELDKFAALSKQHQFTHYLSTPVAQNLATVAVIYCDWNNGAKPYEFARGYLGAPQLNQLKMFYPEPVQRLERDCQ